MRKTAQKNDKANGIIRDTRVLQKAARAKVDSICAICKASFKTTVKMVEQNQHANGKHPKATFAECFPDLVDAEEEEEGEDVEEEAEEETFEATKLWKCVFNQNSMVSDGYRNEVTFDGAVLEVKAPKFAMGAGNVVSTHQLKKVEYADKKAFMGMMKDYLQRIVAHLKAIGNTDRVKPFMGSATEFVKFIVGNYAAFSFYLGESNDPKGSVVFRHVVEGESDATYLFMIDSLKEEDK